MKKLFCILILTASAFGNTTVTGNLKNLGTGNVTATSGAFVRFWLRGCRGNQPRISGSGAIAPQFSGNTFYFDIPADSSGNVSGTLYSTRDLAGTGDGDIECGGSKTAVWYGMQVINGSVSGPEVPIHAKDGATIDISNVTPNTTQPVVNAPTGDTTYARIDGGNTPFTGPITAKKINSVRSASMYTGADIGAKVNAAIADCNKECKIELEPGTYTQTTTISLNGMNIQLECLGGSVSYNGSNGSCHLIWGGATNGVMVDVYTTNNLAVAGMSLNNFTLDCNSVAGTGLRIKSTKLSNFKNLQIFGCTQNGIDIGINASADSAGNDTSLNLFQNINSFFHGSGANAWRIGASGTTVNVSGNTYINVSGTGGTNGDGFRLEYVDNERFYRVDGGASGTGHSFHLTCQSGASSNAFCSREVTVYGLNTGSGGMYQDNNGTSYYPTATNVYGYEICNGSPVPDTTNTVTAGSAFLDIIDCGNLNYGQMGFGLVGGSTVLSYINNYSTGLSVGLPVSLVRTSSNNQNQLVFNSTSAGLGEYFLWQDNGSDKWSLGKNSDNSWGLFDVSTSKFRFLAPAVSGGNAETHINSIGTSGVMVNLDANSGTGGFCVASGGASPATSACINSAGKGTFNGGVDANNAGISNAGAISGISGGSAGKAMCWKTATTLGYCSTTVDATGACTCN